MPKAPDTEGKQGASASERPPDHACETNVGIAPGLLAEEVCWLCGVADKGAQNPCHLDADEGVNAQPDKQEAAVARAFEDEWAV